MLSVATGTDGLPRCSWGISPEEYQLYHDTEWGVPVVDDRQLFEKICLEGFQSGLSWLTILRKRNNFRKVFHDFDIDQVAAMDDSDVLRLLDDISIIRHRGKIEATVNNARVMPELRSEFGSFAAYVWGFEPEQSDPTRSTSPESVAMSNDLKKRGFRFVGPTTVYAFMQAMGMVNDHVDGCTLFPVVAVARANFERP